MKNKKPTAELLIQLNKIDCFRIDIKVLNKDISVEQLENFTSILTTHIEQILENKALNGMNYIH